MVKPINPDFFTIECIIVSGKHLMSPKENHCKKTKDQLTIDKPFDSSVQGKKIMFMEKY